jgi:hypothetical protein
MSMYPSLSRKRMHGVGDGVKSGQFQISCIFYVCLIAPFYSYNEIAPCFFDFLWVWDRNILQSQLHVYEKTKFLKTLLNCHASFSM